MGFNLYTGSSLELLAGAFERSVFSRPGRSVFEPEIVAVQTQGTAAWLRQALAVHNGIAANLSTPFLQNCIEDLAAPLYPGFREATGRLSCEALPWRICSWLADHRNFAEAPARYLKDDPDGLKLYQFSKRMAVLFDQYRIRMPELVEAWRAGETLTRHPEHELWQAELYRAAVGNSPDIEVYLSQFISGNVERHDVKFPEAVSVFGVSSMPRLYLLFFAALSNYTEVYFFYLNPTETYWEAVKSRRDLAHAHLSEAEKIRIAEENNPLLASLGRSGRDFFTEIINLDSVAPVMEDNLQREPEGNSFLNRIQGDIYHNRRSSGAHPDGSIRIFCCHTPMREVEVLHDQLLHELEDRSILPRDILVTAPDINQYIPYIDAVFGAGPLAGSYSITDRAAGNSGTVAPAFLRILQAGRGKFELSEVTALLDCAALRARFGIPEESVPLLNRWLRESGVRWGLDAEHRKTLCGAAFGEYSWKAGLDRILMGAALQENLAVQSGLDVLPYDSAAYCGPEAAGGFAEFLRVFAETAVDLCRPRTLTEWSAAAASVLETFFEPSSDDLPEYGALMRMAGALAESGNICPKLSVSQLVLLEEISGMLGTPDARQPFLRGGITFCSMIPMRSIPMKVIAVLGLNDSMFPRRDEEPAFNLLGGDFRSGNDRGLFLETILAAEKTLILSYAGKNPATGETAPPAVPLGELADVLSTACGVPPEKLISFQKLQPWDPAYFHGSADGLFSYSKEHCESAAELVHHLSGTSAAADPRPRIFALEEFGKKLPEPEVGTLDISDLCGFFLKNASFYLRHVCGLNVSASDFRPELSDSEPMRLEGYEQNNLFRDMIEWRKSGLGFPEIHDILFKTARLPLAESGRRTFQELSDAAGKLAPQEKLDSFRNSRPQCFQVEIDGVRISGTFTLPEGNAEYDMFSMTEPKARHKVRMYMEHIFLCAALPNFYCSNFRALEGPMTLLRPSNPLAALGYFLKLYREGLRAPICFLPSASWALSDPDPAAALEKAMKSFEPGYHSPRSQVEMDDPCAPVIFRKTDFSNPEFLKRFRETAMLFFQSCIPLDPRRNP